ncbi:hypothetical protein [Marinococcus luteus]|uniref:hypothetical protein n=1 Tax=Marinococcus luteus TaxID=1122204 RepID=UPI00115F7BD0|nr:hypothetical protein [Marinococcus luteus]
MRVNATYSVSEVKQLAKSASQSSSERAVGPDFSASEAIGSQAFAAGKEPQWSEGVIQSKTINGDGGASYPTAWKAAILNKILTI